MKERQKRTDGQRDRPEIQQATADVNPVGRIELVGVLSPVTHKKITSGMRGDFHKERYS